MIKNLKALKNIYTRLLFILTRKQKRDALIVFFAMLLCSGLELLGVSAIYPFLEVLMDENALRSAWYFKWVYEIYPEISWSGCIMGVGITIMAIYLLKNGVSLLCIYIQNKYVARFKREISTLMLDSYLKRPYEFFVNSNSGFIIQGVNGDTTACYQILIDGFQIIAECFSIIGIAVFLALTDWFVALAAGMIAAFCFCVIVVGFKSKMKKAGVDYRKASARQFQYSSQAVNGIKEITVMNRRKFFVEQYDINSYVVEKATVINNFISACPDRILEGICVASFMGIVCIRIMINSDLQTFIPVIGTFAMGAFKILPAISKVSSRINSIIYQQSGLKNCYENIKEAREWEKNREKQNLAMATKLEMDTNRFEECLQVENITWRYENSKTDVLKGLSISIKKGETVGFIGPSGAGKTTLADVILGLYMPQSGTVAVDGHNIYTMPEVWAKIIGYVPQSVFLLDDTIRRNIAFGIIDEAIEDEKVWDVLEKAQLKTFVEKLPEGLETIVGERGVKLSGGQRQRIAIARALYDDPDILVLDEATSALDIETEKAVMESIDALQGYKTLIIVAHRLQTVRNCDKIYEINGGIAKEKRKEEIGL